MARGDQVARWDRGLVVAVASGLLAPLPFFRHVAWLGDEGVLLHAAQRMLRGEVPYRDFFEFMPPASFYLTAAWMRLGSSLAVMRVLTLVVMATISALTYWCVRAASRQRAAWLFAVAWLLGTQGEWTVLSHHWFATLFSLAALAGALSPVETARRTALTGLAVGLATLCVPTRGAVLGAVLLAVALWRGSPRLRATPLAVGMALPAAAFGLYLVARGAGRPLLADALGFAASRYPDSQWLPYGANAPLQSAPLVLVFPLALLFTAVIALKTRPQADPVFLVSLGAAVAGLVGCFPRADAPHIAFNAPLALPLLAWNLDTLQRLLRRSLRLFLTAVLGATACGVAGLGYTQQALAAATAPAIETRSAGRFGAGPDTEPAELAALLGRIDTLPAAQTIVFYPYDPMLAFLSGRRHPASVDLFIPYTTAEQLREACTGGLQRADWVMVDRKWSDPLHTREVWPATRTADPPWKRAFERAVEIGFEPFFATGRYELRRRGAASLDEPCARIGP